jgi:hypothetical protein
MPRRRDGNISYDCADQIFFNSPPSSKEFQPGITNIHGTPRVRIGGKLKKLAV